MANTLNTAERQILRSALNAYVAGLAPVNAFSLDADSGTPGTPVGGSVIVKVATARTASLMTSSSPDYETGDTTYTDKTVTLAHWAFASFHLTDYEAGQHAFDFAEKTAVEAAGAVARNVFDNISGFWINGNYGGVAGKAHLASTAASAFDVDDVVTLGQYMDTNNVPSTNRSLILLPEAHATLKKDNSLQDAGASGSTADLREGITGRVDRFDVYMSNGVNTSATETNLGTYAFAVHPTAMAVALRTVPPSDSAVANAAGLRYGEMTDPVSGITLGMRTWYNTKTGTRWGSYESLSGKAAVQANGLYRAKAFA